MRDTKDFVAMFRLARTHDASVDLVNSDGKYDGLAVVAVGKLSATFRQRDKNGVAQTAGGTIMVDYDDLSWASMTLAW